MRVDMAMAMSGAGAGAAAAQELNKFAPGGKWDVVVDGGLQVVAPGPFTLFPTPVVLKAGPKGTLGSGCRATRDGTWSVPWSPAASTIPVVGLVLWVGSPPQAAPGAHLALPAMARARACVPSNTRDAVVAPGTAWPPAPPGGVGLPPLGAVCTPPKALVTAVEEVCSRPPHDGRSVTQLVFTGPLLASWGAHKVPNAAATALGEWRPPLPNPSPATPWGVTAVFGAQTLCSSMHTSGPNSLWLPVAFAGSGWAGQTRVIGSQPLQAFAGAGSRPGSGSGPHAGFTRVAHTLARVGAVEVPLGLLPSVVVEWLASVLNAATRLLPRLAGRAGGVSLHALLGLQRDKATEAAARTALTHLAEVAQVLTAGVAATTDVPSLGLGPGPGPGPGGSGCPLAAAVAWAAAFPCDRPTPLWLVPLMGQAVVQAAHPVFMACTASAALIDGAGSEEELEGASGRVSMSASASASASASVPALAPVPVPELWFRDRVLIGDTTGAGWSEPSAWPPWVFEGAFTRDACLERNRGLQTWPDAMRKTLAVTHPWVVRKQTPPVGSSRKRALVDVDLDLDLDLEHGRLAGGAARLGESPGHV